MQQCLVEQPNWAAGCDAIGELLRVSSESLLDAANNKCSQARIIVETSGGNQW